MHVLTEDSITFQARQAAYALFTNHEDIGPREVRSAEFGHAFVTELAACFAALPAAAQAAAKGASAGAGDLNQSQFQSLIEYMQNADDVRASEVRIAVMPRGNERLLLLIHDGQPVRAQDVLSMVYPYHTTKTDRTDQRGKYGIGLKTLSRLATRVSVYGAPYHFCGTFAGFGPVEPMQAIPGLYDPQRDTLVACTLKPEVSEQALADWFERSWEDASLTFLSSLRSVLLLSADGTVKERSLSFSDWRKFIDSPGSGIEDIGWRHIIKPSAQGTIWKATLRVPEHLSPAHKARAATTTVSIAARTEPAVGRLYVGFPTRIACRLPFSIDAQFDPDTSRENLIENEWNTWLINECGRVLAVVAGTLLLTDPVLAWSLVPLGDERVAIGNDHDWVGQRFDEAFAQARQTLADCDVPVAGASVLRDLSYEDAPLEKVLEPRHLALLFPDKTPLPGKARDAAGRWRLVLDTLRVSQWVGMPDMLRGFDGGLFSSETELWWVQAGNMVAHTYADCALDEEDDPVSPYGVPYLLGDMGQPLACRPAGNSRRPLLLDASVSPFAQRWSLFERLHPAYAETGEQVLRWLEQHAAFARKVDAEAELWAFAELHQGQMFAIEHADLRVLRDHFDLVGAEKAEELGRAVGQVVLLEGYVFQGKKQVKQTVSPTQAYLCRTLDREHPYWPEAAHNVPGIAWISGRYEDHLKTAEGRRRTPIGAVSRGPRKFLQLLCAEVAPRLVATGKSDDDRGLRGQDFRARGANAVRGDIASPDLERVLDAISAATKNDRKQRSPALMRTLSRNWERLYVDNTDVQSYEFKRTTFHPRSPVRARWLLNLLERNWIAVGKGELVTPGCAVIRTPGTQHAYHTGSFAVGLGESDIDSGLARALGLIMNVRVSDNVDYLVKLRDGDQPVDEREVLQTYRSIAQQLQKAGTQAVGGDMTRSQLRSAFSQGQGLVYKNGHWRRSDDMYVGTDVFHDPDRFVSGGKACAALWKALDVREPDVNACIDYCRSLRNRNYDASVEAALIDMLRYMEQRLEDPDAALRKRLRRMPLHTSRGWILDRPVLYVENEDQRCGLAQQLPRLAFWNSPCDAHDLLRFMEGADIKRITPHMHVPGDDLAARLRGEAKRAWFARAVGLMCDALARNQTDARNGMSIDLEELKSLPLHVYDGSFSVRANDPAFGNERPSITVRAVLQTSPRAIHATERALAQRGQCGRVIASFFPAEYRSQVEAEWVVAWTSEQDDVEPEGIRLASDQQRRERLEEEEQRIRDGAGRRGSVKINTASRKEQAQLQQRRRELKDYEEVIEEVKIRFGKCSPGPAPTAKRRKLHEKAPSPSSGTRYASNLPEYSTQELEQRGWEYVMHVLDHSPNERLVDFRGRHGVGADGAVNWKTFVELKATGGGMQSLVTLTVSEYERALKCSNDYILALAYGLEKGQATGVALIFDPIRSAIVRPATDMRVSGIADSDCLRITFGAA